MSLALVHSRARVGVHAPEVRVEVHLSGGLPSTQIVGLPEAAVRESRERVRAALLCAQFEFPARRITINLAPADLPKDGGRFDLPIALGIGADAESRAPMALAVIGGLLSSTLLSLVYVPVVYTVVDDLERWLGRWLGKLLPRQEKPLPETTAPAGS